MPNAKEMLIVKRLMAGVVLKKGSPHATYWSYIYISLMNSAVTGNLSPHLA
jgi:hypothetical protein